MGFLILGNKTFDFSCKKKDSLPKNDQIWPKTGIFGQFGPGHAGLFSALLVGRLVVVARGLYLARHLFTLSYTEQWSLEAEENIDYFLQKIYISAYWKTSWLMILTYWRQRKEIDSMSHKKVSPWSLCLKHDDRDHPPRIGKELFHLVWKVTLTRKEILDLFLFDHFKQPEWEGQTTTGWIQESL